MKMVQRHTENCRGWLNWLNVDVAVGELIKLATTPTSIQLSRCIYKTFGSTQIKLQLVGRPDNPMVIDAVNNDTVISWTNWFCDMLGLPYIDLPKTYFLADVFSQNRVDPGIEVRYLADHKLHGQQVISDALIGRNLWSVTLATNQKKVAGEVSFQNDLQNESDYWIRQLELTNECIAPLGPCRQICPKT